MSLYGTRGIKPVNLMRRACAEPFRARESRISQSEAGYMSATEPTLQVTKTRPLQTRGGPYMFHAIPRLHNICKLARRCRTAMVAPRMPKMAPTPSSDAKKRRPERRHCEFEAEAAQQSGEWRFENHDPHTEQHRRRHPAAKSVQQPHVKERPAHLAVGCANEFHHPELPEPRFNGKGAPLWS